MDKNGKGSRVFSIIASEEHAVHRILELLDSEGIIDGSVADKTFSSSGMISRYRFEDGQQIQDIVGHKACGVERNKIPAFVCTHNIVETFINF